jgi:hypothetical protein
MLGGFNVMSASLNGDNTSINATHLIGQGLVAVGTNSRPAGLSAADWGTTFVGRWNSIDGVKDQTAENVFAVGTGTAEGSRKTGLRIDSGSNTFIEGTLNVSGSSSFSSVVNLSGSLNAYGDVRITTKLETDVTAFIKSNNITGSWGQTNDVGGNALKLDGNLTIQSGSSFYANGNKQFNVGAFQSNVTQSGSANVSQSINFETTDISNGVSIVSNSRITLANAGTYNIQFSAQTVANSGADNLYIWLKKNGTNVTASAGNIELANNAEAIAAWNYVVEAVAGDYFELAWQAGNAGTILLTNTASGNIPSIPSVILTVTQVR